MGQQLNKVIKRRRRKAYLARKNARIKAGIPANSSGRVKRMSGGAGPALPADAAVTAPAPAAKKAAKKAPAAKKTVKPKKEEGAEATAPAAEESAPAETAES